ncbi:hypothetical protein ACLQ2N_08280 [Streptomyces sp. DT224]|uniref:hypothetical protein n=1 Tax=Streptomyces sp. DT224 TaxID=3393426 RepID=UPI003CEB534C
MTTMPKKIEHAPAGKHLTLEELAAFVADAYAAGAHGDDVPTARLSFSGRLQKLVVEVEHE